MLHWQAAHIVTAQQLDALESQLDCVSLLSLRDNRQQLQDRDPCGCELLTCI